MLLGTAVSLSGRSKLYQHQWHAQQLLTKTSKSPQKYIHKKGHIKKTAIRRKCIQRTHHTLYINMFKVGKNHVNLTIDSNKELGHHVLKCSLNPPRNVVLQALSSVNSVFRDSKTTLWTLQIYSVIWKMQKICIY